MKYLTPYMLGALMMATITTDIAGGRYEPKDHVVAAMIWPVIVVYSYYFTVFGETEDETEEQEEETGSGYKV